MHVCVFVLAIRLFVFVSGMSAALNVRPASMLTEEEVNHRPVVRRVGSTKGSLRSVSVRPLGETRMRPVASHDNAPKVYRSTLAGQADALASMSVTNAASVATLEGLVRTSWR